MTSYADKGEQPDYGKFFGFDHIHWWVGNAKMVASWYAVRMGFEIVAYSGLETGNRDCATWVVQQGDIKFAFSSPLSPTAEQKEVLGADMGVHLAQHGDGVKDVAFAVTDAKKLYDAAMAKGAESVREPHTITDENGSVVLATVKTYGDTVHTFVQRGEYSGPFLPGFAAKTVEDPLAGVTPSPKLGVIDHIVGNMPDQEMMPVVEWYEKILQFHRFWSVDDKQIHTEYSSLRSVVMADYDEVIKMPINEPAEGKRKSQIQEYVEHYGGKGVQHIALRTENILEAITHLRARGVQFLNVPQSYYDALSERMKAAGISTKEDIQAIKDLNILVDFDDQGYLLQLFTMPLQDRPTVFLEVIQREGCQGFGAGNFKSLFEAIEREQAKRGNLV